MFPQVLHELVAHNLSANAGRVAVVHDGRSLSYADLAAEIAAWASWLSDRGVGRGDRVGIHLGKSPEEIMLIFAAARLGAVFVDISTTLKPAQVGHVVRDAGIKALAVDRTRFAGLSADGVLDAVETVIVRGDSVPDPRVLSFAQRPRLPTFSGDPPIDLDVAGLFYTSGSTGRPKGVAFTHGNLLSGARAVATYLKNVPNDRILSVLPFSFDYGFSQVTTAFLAGASVILQPVAMAREIAKAAATHAATGLGLVPPAWIELTRYLIESGERLPALRYITNSGGRIPMSTLEQMPTTFAGTDIYLMYGLTEGFRATYLDPALFEAKMGAIGRAIPGTQVFVVHAEKGLCGVGEPGELVQRGSLISRGYWGRPEDTAAKIRPNPFLVPLIGDENVLHSGDTVYADEDGILWFIGRNDGMLKSSGYRISPEEIEEFVMATGFVKEVIAFGMPDAKLGQTIHVAVAWSESANADALMRSCRAGLPSHMVPKSIRDWGEQLPRTSSGKFDRSRIARESPDRRDETDANDTPAAEF